jgi:tRNA-specific 2-thiouridylase
MIKKKEQKVAIAMSGGLDSSVAAFCLKQKYNQVIGITLKLGPFTDKAVLQAQKIAQNLEIKHQVIDLTKEFTQKIISPFCQNYFQGLTPNPCIWCNEKIKFGLLFAKIKEQGFDYLATGHYAKIKKRKGQFCLFQAKDKSRDQSYFLYRLNPDQLSQLIFPLGKLTKQQVRKIARENNLDLAKKESREICFVKDDYREFIKNNCFLNSSPGLIKDKEGNILGKHQGLPFYTIGQRKGLIKGQKEPVYVIAINKETNSLIIGQEKDLYKRELKAKNISWVNKKLRLPLKIKAKIRYRHKPTQAIVTKKDKEELKVEFKKAQRAITPGQSVVFYQKNQVLGGGIITEFN